MTFVNLDNDDEDNQFDNNDNEVTGGDDELIKLDVEITQSSAAKIEIKIRDGIGGSHIKIWKDEQKTTGQDYIMGTELQLTSQGNNKYKTTLWIEGILAHDNNISKTIIEIHNKADEFCIREIPITVLGIESITFEGVGNGFDATTVPVHSSNILDTDDINFTNNAPANQGYYNELKSYRVFSGARLNTNSNGTGKALNVVSVTVNFTIPPIEDFSLSLRAFDIDDPFTDPATDGRNPKKFIDPNDEGIDGIYDGAQQVVADLAAQSNGADLLGTDRYDKQNDNRGLASIMDANGVQKYSKLGHFIKQKGCSTCYDILSENDDYARVKITANSLKHSINFATSTQPGDNYRIVANADEDYIARLRNEDKLDQLAIVDPKIGDGNTGQVLLNRNYMSHILTVWRILHLEQDIMEAPSTNSLIDEGKRFVIDFVQSGTRIVRLKFLSDLQINDASTQLDASFSEVDGKRGRYQLGKVLIESINGQYASACNEYDIFGNNERGLVVYAGKEFDLVGGGNILGYKISKAGLPDIEGTITKMSKVGADFNFTLNVPAGSSVAGYNGGTIKIGNDFLGTSIISTTGVNEITTSKIRIIVVVLDDDIHESTVLPGTGGLQYKWYDENLKIDMTITKSIYRKAYLETKEITAFSEKIPFKDNVDETMGGEHSIHTYAQDYSQLKPIENKDFWGIYVCKAFQGPKLYDNDSNGETGVIRGLNWGTDANASNIKVKTGTDGCITYNEINRESNINNPINFERRLSVTTAHEIGHQLGLGHHGLHEVGGKLVAEISEASNNNMGIMVNGSSLDSNTHYLNNRFTNFIRCRIVNPKH